MSPLDQRLPLQLRWHPFTFMITPPAPSPHLARGLALERVPFKGILSVNCCCLQAIQFDELEGSPLRAAARDGRSSAVVQSHKDGLLRSLPLLAEKNSSADDSSQTCFDSQPVSSVAVDGLFALCHCLSHGHLGGTGARVK